MKFPADKFAELSSAIAEFDTADRRARYIAGKFLRSAEVKDLDKRYRWDLYWDVRPSFPRNWISSDLVDFHLDTALRKIVKPLAPPTP